ncbi:hypothetical protein CAPTEDRAFT_94321, partial [Capitella teleta]
VKCVLVGDGAIGKTSLIVSYTTNGYPLEYVPTAYDNYAVVVTVDNKPIRLQLCDTAGQDDFDSLRPLCYPGTDVFLVCFSVVNPTSFQNVLDKWIPEIRKHSPKVPVILVGTQSDLRGDVKILVELDQYEERPVTEEQAIARTRSLGAVSYVECSALTQKNLKDVFDTCILAAMDKKGLLEKVKGRGSIKYKCKSVLWRGNSNQSGAEKPKKRWKKLLCLA